MELTERDKAMMLYGALYISARNLKEDGCFEDMTNEQVMNMLCEDINVESILDKVKFK